MKFRNLRSCLFLFRLYNIYGGGKRIVISYLSIGEAEDYRGYWKKEWSKKWPKWIVKENPDWKGNYIVKYWNSEWKNVIKEYREKLGSFT